MITSDLTAERIREYLSQGKRFDGRKPEDLRELIIETGVSKNAEGSAKVKLGKTEVLVGVKLAVGTPYPDSKDKGNLMVTAEFLPLSSPRIDLGPPQFDSIELARVIDRGIRESHFIELEKLCIKEGEKVWTVFIDIYTINDDGNLLDAAGIGAVAALRNAKVPVYDEAEEKVDYKKESAQSVPLKKELPISLTIHKLGESLVVDPTREEEDISETRVTVCMADGIIHSMQKGNSKEITTEEFNKVLDLIEKLEKDILTKIESLK